MHGKIWVESQPVDTTFTFKIPCQVYATSINEDADAQKNIIAADNYAIRKQQQDEKDNRKIKILVVEDNVINQKLLKRFIERAGYTCIIAENGQEAIDMYQENNMKDDGDKNHQKIDLIFMDIEMPVMDGLLATLNIRQLEKQQQKEKGDKFSPVFIIGLSGNARSQYIKLAMDSGMDDYMTKPVTAQQIVDVIWKFVSQKSRNSDNQKQ
jgi:CheY-like chemotaxis protein